MSGELLTADRRDSHGGLLHGFSNPARRDNDFFQGVGGPFDLLRLNDKSAIVGEDDYKK